jgi:hypothetical protein
MEVGIVFAAAPVGVVGVKDRLFVRLIVKLVAPVAAGTVMTTGDHVAGVVPTASEPGLSAAQAADPATCVPQK